MSELLIALDKEQRFNELKTLRELLELCTEGQQTKFAKIFGSLDVELVPEDKIRGAIQLCERTVKLNQER